MKAPPQAQSPRRVWRRCSTGARLPLVFTSGGNTHKRTYAYYPGACERNRFSRRPLSRIILVGGSGQSRESVLNDTRPLVACELTLSAGYRIKLKSLYIAGSRQSCGTGVAPHRTVTLLMPSSASIALPVNLLGALVLVVQVSLHLMQSRFLTE